MADTIYPGNALAWQVLAGASFSAGALYGAAGTMTNNGAQTFTPGASDITGWSGYFSGLTVKGVPVDATKVLTGTTIAGTAGSMPNNGALGTITPTTAAHPIPSGYTTGGTVSGDVNLVAANILSGVSIFGVLGSLVQGVPYATGTVTSSASTLSGFTDSAGTNHVLNYITVSGLTFTPKYIAVAMSTGANDWMVYDSYESIGGSTGNQIYNSQINPFYFKLGGSATVTTGFQLPVLQVSKPYTWRAWG